MLFPPRIIVIVNVDVDIDVLLVFKSLQVSDGSAKSLGTAPEAALASAATTEAQDET